MKRRDTYNHIDRNHIAINGDYQKPQRTNIVGPEFLLGQIWIQEQESNAVKIIELDSSSSSNNINENDDKQPLSHAWSYVNKDRFRMQQSPTDNYEVNYKARQKNLEKPNRYNYEMSSPDDDKEENNISNFVYSNFKESENSVNRTFTSQRKVNCFTNTHQYPKTSDSSTDVEYIDPNDLQKELMSWGADDRYYEEILTCNSNIDTEKRTIYIYSYKNNHLFTENEGMNISYSSSTTDTDVQELEKSSERIPSPIPDLYVPKMNLIQPPKLATVTEITEPKNCEESFRLKYDATMPKNGWFLNTSRNQGDYRHSADNLISWMSLSPRQKRRRSGNTFCKNCRHQARLQMIREGSHINELDTQNAKKFNEAALPVAEGLSPRILCINQGTDDKMSINDVCVENENPAEDKNDHVLKPKIRLRPKTSEETIKSKSIETLNINNGTSDETIVIKKEISSHSFQNTDSADNTGSNVEDDMSKRLWEKNTVAYDIVPSLHLSIETEIEEMSCFKRIIRCLKCFK